MSGASQVGCPNGFKAFKRPALILASCLLLAASSLGQRQFGQTRLGLTPGGYPLPSVTSIGSNFLPFPAPSVSSIPNTGFGNGFHHGAGFNHGGRFRSRGATFAAPYYYVPLGGYGYGYDYVGGADMYSGSPDMYSGPPDRYSPGPNESTLHIIVEQAPAQLYRAPADDPQAISAPPPRTVQQQASPAPDAKPLEPTVLVFRDGHRQEVTNYAIMGQTVYVLDNRTQKISLADLDVPATVKANDDRGMEFKVPPQKPAPKRADIELKVPVQPETTSPANIASVAP